MLAEEESSEKSGIEDVQCLERFTSEHDNFLAALEWLTETGDADWGLRLGAALFRFWEAREHLAEGRDWLDKLLKLPAAAAPTKARARALFAAAVLAGEQGDYASADALMIEKVRISRASWVTKRVSPFLSTPWPSSPMTGVISQLHTPSSKKVSCCGGNWATRRPSLVLSVTWRMSHKLQGDYDRARSLYAECLTIFRRTGRSDRRRLVP